MSAEEMLAIEKISPQQYRIKLSTSRAVLCMSGLGYDTYRLWETLAAGWVVTVSLFVRIIEW